jgi:hypothetical protein
MHRVLLLCVLLGSALTACSGQSVPAVPGGPAPLGSARGAAVRFVIVVSHDTQHRERPRYISPATKSVTFAITPRAGGTPVPLPSGGIVNVATGAGCTKRDGTTQCSVTFPLAPGAYRANVATFDRTGGTGNELSGGASLPFTLSAGANNVVALTLDGVPRTLVVTAGAYAVHGSASSGFTLYGGAAQEFAVVARDAAGYAIVGPGAPTFKLTGGATGWTAATPSPSNTFSIVPPNANGSRATFTIAAKLGTLPCPAGAACKTTFSIVNDIQKLFVVNEGASHSVVQYALPLSAASSPVAQINDGAIGGGNGDETAALAPNGDIAIANCASTCGGALPDSVTVYAPPAGLASGPTTPLATITAGVSDPLSVAFDTRDRLWVGNDAGTIGAYASPYTSQAASLALGGSPIGLIFDHTGKLVILDCEASCEEGSSTSDFLAGYAGGSTITKAAIGIVYPWFAALDANDDLFVAFRQAGHRTVNEFTSPLPTSGTATPAHSLTTSGIAYGLALDDIGNLFVANCGTGCQLSTPDSLLELAAPYDGTAATIGTSAGDGDVSRPESVAVDGFGNLIVANSYDGDILSYAPPYVGVKPIVLGYETAPEQLLLTP